MPFAGGGRRVAHLAESLGGRPDRRVEREGIGLGTLHQPRHPVDMGVQSGHDGAAARAAERRRGETTLEADAVGSQAVEVRSARDRMAVATQIVPAVIVGDN